MNYDGDREEEDNIINEQMNLVEEFANDIP